MSQVNQLKSQICELQKDLAVNSFNLRREAKAMRTVNLPDLLNARSQILLSIAIRQGKLIQLLDIDAKTQDRKVA